jgi:mannosyltransferase OCH1-like enzyme
MVAELLPDLLPTYDRYPCAILRADAFRYAVLLVEGGVYVGWMSNVCGRSTPCSRHSRVF